MPRRLAVLVARLVSVLAVVPLLISPCPACADALFTGLGIPADARSSGAADVSGDGSVAAGFVNRGTASDDEAARWTAGGIELLGFLPSTSYSNAQAISDDGHTIVGRVGGSQAYRWHDGTMVGLGNPPGSSGSTAYGVSADGAVVVGAAAGGIQQAFRWTGAGMVGLGDLSGGITLSDARGVSADGSIVVGASFSGNGQEAFRWTQASGMVGLGDLSGGTFDSGADGISADGTWVVGRGSAASGSEAMRWSEATGMLALGVLPGTGTSQAFDVSHDGSIIVGTSNNVAFVWDEQHGMRDLKQVLEQNFGLDLTDWYLTAATGVSADGLTVVGQGVNPQGRPEAWLAMIPEPASRTLLGLGLVVLTARRRSRRCA